TDSGSRKFPICSDSPVETLSFDLLQFLYHLALAILVGGSLVLGTAVAPALFGSAGSRGEAGTLFGSVLARFDGLAVFSVIVLVITSVLKAIGFEVTGTPDARLLLRWVALGVLALSTTWASASPSPANRPIRSPPPSTIWTLGAMAASGSGCGDGRTSSPRTSAFTTESFSSRSRRSFQ